MKEDIEERLERLSHKNSFIESLNEVLNSFTPEFLELFVQLAVKIILVLILTFFLDEFFKRILIPTLKRLVKRSKTQWDDVFYERRVFHALIHFIPIVIVYQLQSHIFYNHPSFYVFLDKIFFLASLLLFYILFFRLISAWEQLAVDDSEYKSVAIKSFMQLIKIFGIIVGCFVVFFTLFNVDGKSILTVLGATTAFILLVFKDPILGFVAGIQVSSSKMLKVGDWIQIPKYDLEGNITEINLITSKIINFDKTISSIPTYDLISTEVRNLETINTQNKKRIKRAIYCSVKSFQFLKEEDLNKLNEIPLLRNYIQHKTIEIETYNAQSPSHKRQLTNIGLFRKYIELFLTENKYIDSEEIIMVRQLEMKPNGLPIEIYCFTSEIIIENYENVVSDIFDHILTISQEFKIEIVQTISL